MFFDRSPQVNPTKYKGLGSTLKMLGAEEGSRGLWKGVGPTFVGYSLQGMFKYGLYEVFKDTYMNAAGEELSTNYKPLIWLAGSASAEVFADIALCPLEMTKVKIQTSATGTFPIPFGAALREMSKTKIETRFPFGSLVPLWSRQVSACLPDTSIHYLLTIRVITDPLHHGQVLFLREDRLALLHPRLHRAQGDLLQAHPARCHLRLRLPRRCRLRYRLSPRRLPRFTPR